MSEWKKVKIGDFLHQYRNTMYVEDSEIYRQITISSKVGIKYRCSKIGKEIGRKRQFKIDLKNNPNTVIFTRQGLHEGSIGIAPQEVDGCIVTENMPMFSIDESIVLSAYLKLLFKYSLFTELIGILTPTGSAQKSIHERDLLPLEISIPDLSTQKAIVENLSHQLMKNEDLLQEIEKQKSLVKQLRQNILQDAIEGKLTEEWRKNNPVIKGNPDFDAEALFEKIQEEKKKCKNEKLQEPIFEEEIDIPSNWKYPSLFEITRQITDGTHMTPSYVKNGEIFLSAQNVKPFRFIPENHKYVSKTDFDVYRNNRMPEINDILMARVGAGIGEAAVIDTNLQFAFYVSLCLIKIFPKILDSNYLTIVLNSSYGVRYAKNNISSSGASAGNYNLGHIRALKVPLPPLAEQKEIVRVVESQLAKVDQLEKQITEREIMTKQLMQSILKDAFGEG